MEKFKITWHSAAAAGIYVFLAVYLLLERLFFMFLDRYALSSAIRAALTATNYFEGFLYAAAAVFLLLTAAHSARRLRAGLAVFAAGEAARFVNYLLNALYSSSPSMLALNLALCVLTQLLSAAAFICIALDRTVARDVKPCAFITLAVVFTLNLSSCVSALAALMLTGNGYVVLWVAALSYAGKFSLIFGVVGNALTALLLILLRFRPAPESTLKNESPAPPDGE